ncbi:MAG TPA: HEAT repeat domain-containing protein [Planctomycetaceae bacterium]|nr:HEAT repeat domain-containing protein [Planctomycetaceae bacterium]
MFESQTACYAKDRRKAIDKLGDKFDCVCNPEIMAAFIYALNDTDERVRAEAADEIGDQIRKSDGACCTQEVVEALTAALADCDPKVRRQAQEALEACGYEVVDGCCKKKEKCVEGDKCVADKCAPAVSGPAPESKALAPVPSVLQQTSAKISGRLSRLFDLLD